MQKIGLFYGSSTGNCEIVAREIQKILGNENVDVFDIAVCDKQDINRYQQLIIGVSTWGIGDLQEDWETFISNFSGENMQNKTIALFGLGDQQTYADSFVNGMGIMYEHLKNTGCRIVGSWPAKGYKFDESKALKNGHFVGLVIDEDSQSNLTQPRIKTWIQQVKKHFN